MVSGSNIKDNADFIVLIIHSYDFVVVLLCFMRLVVNALSQFTVIKNERTCIAIKEINMVLMFFLVEFWSPFA